MFLSASCGRCTGLVIALALVPIAIWLSYNHWTLNVDDPLPFDVPTVLSGLLAAESEATVRLGALVVVGFGGCLDHVSSGIAALKQLGAKPPEAPENVNELNNLSEMESAFAYYFKNGASAGRATKNVTFFSEVERALLTSSDTRTGVGGNAPVMAKRFVEEGVDVVLGAQMSSALRSQLDPRITVIGQRVDEQDTHLIFEYEKGDVWGRYSAPRANRFILHNTVGDNQFTSLLEDVSREVTRLRPSLLVVGGLRMMLGVDSAQAEGPRLLDRLSQLLGASRSSVLVHVELSSFPDNRQLSRIVNSVVRHADSIGLNEQELPRLRRHLDGDRSDVPKASENSQPTVADILDDARAVYKSLRLSTLGPHRFSRIHVHTLGFHVLLTEAGDMWPNGRAAVAKAALTSNRHTCGSRVIDVDRSRLLLDAAVDIGGDKSKVIHLDGRRPAVCWNESDMEICIAPVLVCKKVVQTVGGGDNVSAAGLVLQI